MRVPTWLASGLGGLVLGSGVCGSLLAAVGHRWESASRAPDRFLQAQYAGRYYSSNSPMLLAAPASLLVPGTPAPQLTGLGWVNGPSPADLHGKVVVLDLWADW